MNKMIGTALEQALTQADCIDIEMYDGRVASIRLTNRKGLQSVKASFINLVSCLLEQGIDCKLSFVDNNAIFVPNVTVGDSWSFPLNLDGVDQFTEYLSEQFFNATASEEISEETAEHPARCTQHECGHSCSDCHDCSCQYAPDVMCMLWGELTKEQREHVLNQLDETTRSTFVVQLAKERMKEPAGLQTADVPAIDDEGNPVDTDEQNESSNEDEPDTKTEDADTPISPEAQNQ